MSRYTKQIYNIFLSCILFYMLSTSHLYGQLVPANNDSLPEALSERQRIRQLPANFLKGIAASNYKKDSKIEYFPLTSLELPSVFLPANSTHPRMLTLLQIQRARQNIPREPYQTWSQLLKEQTDPYIIQNNPVLKEPTLKSVEDIKTLAFIYRVENDERYLIAITKLLSQLPEPPKVVNIEGGANSHGWGDFLESAQAIPAICVALDLVYDDIETSIRNRTRRILSEIAQQLLNALILSLIHI